MLIRTTFIAPIYLYILLTALYLVVARLVTLKGPGGTRGVGFAATNIVFLGMSLAIMLGPGSAALLLGFYSVATALHHALVARWAGARSWRPVAAFGFPILLLILCKYMLGISPAFWQALRRPELGPEAFVGLSYMAFRMSFFVLEVRSQRVALPSLPAYLGFVFLVPTFFQGPINRYQLHEKGAPDLDGSPPTWRWASVRLAVGLQKVVFLSPILNLLTYGGLLLDGHPHGLIDLVVVTLVYPVYLYVNFSGASDIAIAIAGFLGISVMENFERPLLATSIREFWNRWHMSLSFYLRDVVFIPLSKFLSEVFGIQHTGAANAIAAVVVFTLMGLWHGLQANFILFGLVHGLAVAINHFFADQVRVRLGVKRFRVYRSSRRVAVASWALTYGFVAVAFFLFANDLDQILRIRDALHGVVENPLLFNAP